MALPELQTTFIPLAFFISLGWIIGRTLDIDLKSVASLLIYAIAPIVAFGSTAQLSFHGVFVLLPIITFILATICGLVSLGIGQQFLDKKEQNYLLPLATGSGNNGYFGLPLAMAIFVPEHIGIYFLIILGIIIFEVTIGYYFVARGHLTIAHALKKVVRMPMVYAIAAGLIVAAVQIKLDSSLLKLWDIARGCYVSLGMMIIGIALAKHKKLALEMDFIAVSIIGKYGLWLLLIFSFIWMDYHIFKLYGRETYQMLLILTITPVGANTAAFASENNFKPQLAATTVFLTTILSFLLLPVVLPWLLSQAY